MVSRGSRRWRCGRDKLVYEPLSVRFCPLLVSTLDGSEVVVELEDVRNVRLQRDLVPMLGATRFGTLGLPAK